MRRALVSIVVMILFVPAGHAQEAIRVGAKHFNEGYILSEMISILLEDGGFRVQRTFNLGGTTVAFEALRNNAIDVYPEYTGTLSAEILNEPSFGELHQIDSLLHERYDLHISTPYGFNNTYALLMDPALAKKLSITKISDLQDYPELTVGLSYEFLKRKDGWENLAATYRLPHTARGLEHGLAYQALREGKIDITDAYSTDGEIQHYKLMLLPDDRHFFPSYQAVSLYRNSLPEKARKILDKLSSSINEDEMQHMNSLALFDQKSHAEIARDFLIQKKLIQSDTAKSSPDSWQEILLHAVEHIKLTFLSLVAAVLVAVPAGIWLRRFPSLTKVILYVTSILQTVPSIALLALMIPLFGIGAVPAVIALFLYALLPILRNTMVGLDTVDPLLKKVARSLGMNAWQSLRYVEFPLAIPTILTGIRTAAVINVGTATLAAFIGAGGLGEFIVTGLALNNTSLILQGAIPAALLAILIELLFEGLEWKLVPKHLRQQQ